MSELSILLLTVVLIAVLAVLMLSMVALIVVVLMFFEVRQMRSEVDEIFNTCANVEEYMAMQAQAEGITAIQNWSPYLESF